MLRGASLLFQLAFRVGKHCQDVEAEVAPDERPLEDTLQGFMLPVNQDPKVLL